MGDVYVAWDEKSGEVALKVPKLAHDVADEVLARFERERRAAAKLSHPNICPVFDVGDDDGVCYLVMPLVSGVLLYRRADAGQGMPPREAVSVRKIAPCWPTHAAGVIHRDLKPQNIMLDPKGEPVIMDFGLARAMHDSRLTKRAMMGTPAYMPIEQFQGKPDGRPARCDVDSLGVIFYELLCGRLPFDCESTYEIMAAVMTAEPVPPLGESAVHSAGVEAVCLKAMAKKRD